MRNKLKIIKKNITGKNTILFSQIAVIALMIAIPVFVIAGQKKTQTQQMAATQRVQYGASCGVNACFSCSNYVDGQTCSPSTDSGPNGVPYCIESNPSCNGSTPTFIIHKCEATSTGSLTGTYRTYSQVGWGSINGCSDNCYPTNPCAGSSGSTGSTGSTGSVSSSKQINGQGNDYVTISADTQQPKCYPDPSSKTGQEICTVNIVAGANSKTYNWTTTKPNQTNINGIVYHKSSSDASKGQIAPSSQVSIDVLINCSPNSPTKTTTLDFNFDTPNKDKATASLQCDSAISVTFAITGLAKPPVHSNRTLQLVFVPADNSQANPINISGNALYDSSTGNYNVTIPIDQIPPGKYQIKLHIDGTLDSQLTQPNGDSSFTFPSYSNSKLVTVIPGDIGPGTKGDNFIDIIDYNKLISCLNKPATGTCASADLNDDGKVDDADLSLLLGQFGSLGFSFTTPQFSCSIDPNCNSGQNSIQMCSLICTKSN